MSWVNFGEVLSYLLCFSGGSESEPEGENDVEEEIESISEQLSDEATKEFSEIALSGEPETGKINI